MRDVRRSLPLSALVALAALAVANCGGGQQATTTDVMTDVITEDHDEFAALEQAIMAEEGFRSKPYRDSLGVETIGFGTNLQEGITRHEAQYLMRGRLVAHIRGLEKAWPRFAELPHHAQAALADMAYQEGIPHLLGFHDMLACLEGEPPDLQCAHDAALDSLWADETPDRAGRVADRLRGPS